MCVLSTLSYLLVYRDFIQLLAFYHQHDLSRAGDKLAQKHDLFHESVHFWGVILKEVLVHSVRLHSISKVLAKPTEFEQSSITFIWPLHFLHTVNFVISVSMEMITFLSRELGFLTYNVLP